MRTFRPSNSTLELQNDRIRFAPAGDEDSQDTVAKQGASIRTVSSVGTLPAFIKFMQVAQRAQTVGGAIKNDEIFL